MTGNKMSSRPLLWMALDMVFFSIPDQNKEMQEENPVLPHLLAHCSSQVTLELPTVLRASPKLNAASRGGETEPQGNYLDIFWSPCNSTREGKKRLPKPSHCLWRSVQPTSLEHLCSTFPWVGLCSPLLLILITRF